MVLEGDIVSLADTVGKLGHLLLDLGAVLLVVGGQFRDEGLDHVVNARLNSRFFKLINLSLSGGDLLADDVPLKDHLRTLYNSVMHTRSQKSRVSADLARLKAARTKSEPTHGTRPAGPVERKITSDMSLNEKVRLAVELAQSGG